MTRRALLSLARTKMTSPYVSVRRGPEGVWVIEITNFSCAEGFEIHGLTRAGVVRSAAKVLGCWKTEEPK